MAPSQLQGTSEGMCTACDAAMMLSEDTRPLGDHGGIIIFGDTSMAAMWHKVQA